MGVIEQERRPIGYWLKHLDRLIEEAFERTLSADGLARRHWQVLNTLSMGGKTNVDLAVALQPFVGDDATATEIVARDLVSRGWVRQLESSELELTETGRSAHAAVLKRVTAIRQLLRRGITDDEYVSVVAVLQRMASNLESAGP